MLEDSWIDPVPVADAIRREWLSSPLPRSYVGALGLGLQQVEAEWKGKPRNGRAESAQVVYEIAAPSLGTNT